MSLSLAERISLALWRMCDCDTCRENQRRGYLLAEWPSLVDQGLPSVLPTEGLEDAEEVIEEAFGEESGGADD